MKFVLSLLLMSLNATSFADSSSNSYARKYFEESITVSADLNNRVHYYGNVWGHAGLNSSVPLLRDIAYTVKVRKDAKKNAKLLGTKFCREETGDMGSKASIKSLTHLPGEEIQVEHNSITGNALYRVEFVCE